MIDVVLMSLSLMLSWYHTSFWCFKVITSNKQISFKHHMKHHMNSVTRFLLNKWKSKNIKGKKTELMNRENFDFYHKLPMKVKIQDISSKFKYWKIKGKCVLNSNAFREFWIFLLKFVWRSVFFHWMFWLNETVSTFQ